MHDPSLKHILLYKVGGVSAASFFCAAEAIVVTERKQCYLVNFRANRVLASAGALARTLHRDITADRPNRLVLLLKKAACCIQLCAALFASNLLISGIALCVGPTASLYICTLPLKPFFSQSAAATNHAMWWTLAISAQAFQKEQGYVSANPAALSVCELLICEREQDFDQTLGAEQSERKSKRPLTTNLESSYFLRSFLNHQPGMWYWRVGGKIWRFY